MINERTPNVPQLRKYVEWVEEQDALPMIDRTWYQRWWNSAPEAMAAVLTEQTGLSTKNRREVEHRCGTAYCLAGKVAADHDERYQTNEWVNGVHCSDVALEVLGLPSSGWGTKHEIFYGSNTAADIRRIAETWAGERL